MRGSPGSVAGMVEAEFRVWVLAHVAGSREPGTTFGDRGGRSWEEEWRLGCICAENALGDAELWQRAFRLSHTKPPNQDKTVVFCGQRDKGECSECRQAQSKLFPGFCYAVSLPPFLSSESPSAAASSGHLRSQL